MDDYWLLLPAALAVVSLFVLLVQAFSNRNVEKSVAHINKPDPVIVRLFDALRLVICLVLVSFLVWEISSNLGSLRHLIMFSLLAFFVRHLVF
jgi:hypothetical protein